MVINVCMMSLMIKELLKLHKRTKILFENFMYEQIVYQLFSTFYQMDTNLINIIKY
jgi:hypothetical protein